MGNSNNMDIAEKLADALRDALLAYDDGSPICQSPTEYKRVRALLDEFEHWKETK